MSVFLQTVFCLQLSQRLLRTGSKLKISLSFSKTPKMPLSEACSAVEPSNTFFYFAFGSNLLTERIHINNPSAKFVDVAQLKGYQLEFNYFSKRWQGAAATVNPVSQDTHKAFSEANEEPSVWGVLWEINIEDRPNLDTQEGVKVDASGHHVGVYQPLQVQVKRKSSGETLMARTYQLIRPLEEDRRPSKVYLDVIKRGAREHHLPENYLKFLNSIEHNGYDSEVEVKLDLTKV